MAQENEELHGDMFEALFGEAVLIGLANVLGQSGSQATLKYMGLGPKPSDPEKIDAGLVTIFHKQGALVIERQILRALVDRLDERYFESRRMNFKEKVEELKSKFGPFGGEGT